MDRSNTKIMLYTRSSSAEQNTLTQQLNHLGFIDIENVSSHDQLKHSNAKNAFLVLLLTDFTAEHNALLDILHCADQIPVLGLFSSDSPHYLRPVIDACAEVEAFPCSINTLDFRIKKALCNGRLFPDVCDTLLLQHNIIGNSPQFHRLLQQVHKVAECDAPVYMESETGTGKELIARAIHYSGPRRQGPFVAANCGALPDQLIENELFGHEHGAYTDANSSSRGLVEQAYSGTLFLDEVATLSPKGQAVLLRFLEDLTYRPLGSQVQKSADLRIIIATNESIESLVKKGLFRSDLYYRINIMRLTIPPLRERKEDITLLAEFFIQGFQKRYKQPQRRLHPNTLNALTFHDWPGNVRELENLLHREFLLCEGNEIVLPEMDALQKERREGIGDRRLRDLMHQPLKAAKQEMIGNFERQYLANALSRANGNISEAARIAGKERRAFTRLLEKYGFTREPSKSLDSQTSINLTNH